MEDCLCMLLSCSHVYCFQCKSQRFARLNQVTFPFQCIDQDSYQCLRPYNIQASTSLHQDLPTLARTQVLPLVDILELSLPDNHFRWMEACEVQEHQRDYQQHLSSYHLFLFLRMMNLLNISWVQLFQYLDTYFLVALACLAYQQLHIWGYDTCIHRQVYLYSFS